MASPNASAGVGGAVVALLLVEQLVDACAHAQPHATAAALLLREQVIRPAFTLCCAYLRWLARHKLQVVCQSHDTTSVVDDVVTLLRTDYEMLRLACDVTTHVLTRMFAPQDGREVDVEVAVFPSTWTTVASGDPVDSCFGASLALMQCFSFHLRSHDGAPLDFINTVEASLRCCCACVCAVATVWTHAREAARADALLQHVTSLCVCAQLLVDVSAAPQPCAHADELAPLLTEIARVQACMCIGCDMHTLLASRYCHAWLCALLSLTTTLLSTSPAVLWVHLLPCASECVCTWAMVSAYVTSHARNSDAPAQRMEFVAGAIRTLAPLILARVASPCAMTSDASEIWHAHAASLLCYCAAYALDELSTRLKVSVPVLSDDHAGMISFAVELIDASMTLCDVCPSAVATQGYTGQHAWSHAHSLDSLHTRALREYLMGLTPPGTTAVTMFAAFMCGSPPAFCSSAALAAPGVTWTVNPMHASGHSIISRASMTRTGVRLHLPAQIRDFLSPHLHALSDTGSPCPRIDEEDTPDMNSADTGSTSCVPDSVSAEMCERAIANACYTLLSCVSHVWSHARTAAACARDDIVDAICDRLTAALTLVTTACGPAPAVSKVHTSTPALRHACIAFVTNYMTWYRKRRGAFGAAGSAVNMLDVMRVTLDIQHPCETLDVALAALLGVARAAAAERDAHLNMAAMSCFADCVLDALASSTAPSNAMPMFVGSNCTNAPQDTVGEDVARTVTLRHCVTAGLSRVLADCMHVRMRSRVMCALTSVLHTHARMLTAPSTSVEGHLVPHSDAPRDGSLLPNTRKNMFQLRDPDAPVDTYAFDAATPWMVSFLAPVEALLAAARSKLHTPSWTVGTCYPLCAREHVCKTVAAADLVGLRPVVCCILRDLRGVYDSARNSQEYRRVHEWSMTTHAHLFVYVVAVQYRHDTHVLTPLLRMLHAMCDNSHARIMFPPAHADGYIIWSVLARSLLCLAPHIAARTTPEDTASHKLVLLLLMCMCDALCARYASLGAILALGDSAPVQLWHDCLMLLSRLPAHVVPQSAKLQHAVSRSLRVLVVAPLPSIPGLRLRARVTPWNGDLFVPSPPTLPPLYAMDVRAFVTLFHHATAVLLLAQSRPEDAIAGAVYIRALLAYEYDVAYACSHAPHDDVMFGTPACLRMTLVHAQTAVRAVADVHAALAAAGHSVAGADFFAHVLHVAALCKEDDAAVLDVLSNVLLLNMHLRPDAFRAYMTSVQDSSGTAAVHHMQDLGAHAGDVHRATDERESAAFAAVFRSCVKKLVQVAAL